MKRPRRPTMSAIRMRRSEYLAVSAETSYGRVIREEKASRRSSFVKPTK